MPPNHHSSIERKTIQIPDPVGRVVELTRAIAVAKKQTGFQLQPMDLHVSDQEIIESLETTKKLCYLTRFGVTREEVLKRLNLDPQ